MSIELYRAPFDENGTNYEMIAKAIPAFGSGSKKLHCVHISRVEIKDGFQYSRSGDRCIRLLFSKAYLPVQQFRACKEEIRQLATVQASTFTSDGTPERDAFMACLKALSAIK